jgi:biopolymer transport protein TolQ
MPILTAAFFYLLQSDSGAVPAAAPSGITGSSAIADLMGNIGTVAICVLVLLLISSLYSWTIIFGKASALKKATRESKRFIRAFRKASQLKEVSALAKECPGSPLAQVFEDVYETYKRQTGGSGPPRNIVALERTAMTASSEAVTTLERRMTWLATIASSSPFVGLFGTVMGVVDAFHGLGTAGSGTLKAVAPGIAEALITTAAGLFVAVPAVVGYNQLSARIRIFGSAIDDFCRELLNSLEEIPVRTAAPATLPKTPGAEMPREAERGVYK